METHTTTGFLHPGALDSLIPRLESKPLLPEEFSCYIKNMVSVDPRGNKGTTRKPSKIEKFVLTGSILGQNRRRHDSILESARFGHLDIVSEKELFLSIFCVIPIEMFVLLNMRIKYCYVP